jgi:hypothetical protein
MFSWQGLSLNLLRTNLFSSIFTLSDDCFPQMPKHVAIIADKHVTDSFYFLIAKNTDSHDVASSCGKKCCQILGNMLSLSSD